MALRLQYFTIIVRRSDLARCHDLPDDLRNLRADGGFLRLGTSWYDAHLWCDTTMSGPDDEIDAWQARGLRLFLDDGRRAWQEVCLAASQRGPTYPCEWLEFDPVENCVWLKGARKGRVIGGQQQFEQERARCEELEKRANDSLARIPAASSPRSGYDDAMGALTGALEIAAFLHDGEALQRLQQLKQASDSRFRTFSGRQR
jgi:hypothetical protein